MANNIAFTLRFQQTLANHLFVEVDDNSHIFRGVTFPHGHNISAGDNTVIHDDIHFDDREKLTIDDRVSTSDSVHIYSCLYDTADQIEVRNYHTTIDGDMRATYDATVSTNVSVGENAIVDTWSIVQSGVLAHHITVGSPAKSMKAESDFGEIVEPFDAGSEHRTDEREILYELPGNIEVSSEFNRNFGGPVDSHQHE